MNAAIYARKSTREEGKTEEEKSVTRQRDHALDYAKKKGWTVPPECIWVEPKEISGGTLERPALNALRKALRPKPKFQKLIVMDKDRLSRDLSDGLMLLNEVHRAGVEIWEYLHDKPVRLGTPTEKLVEAVQLFGGEQERFQIGLRTKDALRKKREADYAIGPAPYGWKNNKVIVNDKHQHSTREQVPEQAKVIKRMAELYVGGMSQRKIAHLLNDKNCSAPVPREKGRVQAWTGHTVRSILLRASTETLLGDRLWQRVQEQFSRSPALPKNHPSRLGRTEGKYLLSGAAVCGQCGGSLVSLSNWGYQCGNFHQRGLKACKNDLTMPQQIVDNAVLAMIEREVFPTPEHVVAIINGATRDTLKVTKKTPDLTKELAKVEAELAKYVAMVAKIGDDDALAAEITKRKTRKAEIVADLQVEKKPVKIDGNTIKREVAKTVEQWKERLTNGQKRSVLHSLLRSKLTFTPREDNGRPFYEFTGEGNFSPILEGVTSAKGLQSGPPPYG